MIEGLKPYEEYKESGQAWLGVVPAHWGVIPNRALFDEVKDKNHPSEEMLSVTITRGIIRQRALLSDTAKKDSSNINKGAYKLVQPGDIAYNKMRAWQGAMGASSFRGIISPAYVVMRPRSGVSSWYYHHLYRTPTFAKEAERWSYGITSDMWSLRPEHFKVIYSVEPSPDEQAAIVRFLDHANRKIDGFIRAKRKLIALLGEQKQAIIHRAVTRGLDPNAPLKPSGIPWLGDIPKHWEVWAFVRCTIERADYRGATPEKVESGVFLVTAKNIRKGWVDYESSKEYVRSSEYSKIMRRGLPKIGDVLFTTEAPLGHIALVDREDVAFAQRIIRFRLNPKRLLPSFALLCLNSAYFQNQLRERATGSTAQGIKASKLPQLAVVFPVLEEQQDIVSNTEKQCAPLVTAIARTEREIALMQEYRTRLTADVVTGKLDVRKAAATLPSETLAPDVANDPEVFVETELEEEDALA
ncbi:MAG: restriction endonuclease subunit S [Chthoniobacterales bacterium]